ncbi:MAG: 3-isopropylmalate dehydratase large subunit, partial [Crenarchaeota archaeon]|nr:3-isopropylmalate dehydratase large subunit [Thermoproteota archaeon]
MLCTPLKRGAPGPADHTRSSVLPGRSAVEKIIAAHLVEGSPEPGEHAVVRVDLLYAHDGTAPLALKVLRDLGVEGVWDPRRILFFIDHVAPSTNPRNSILHNMMREFAARHGIRLYEPGHGICHQVVFEEGYSAPGMLIMGADSHTVMQGAVGAAAMGIGSTDAALIMATGTTWIRVPEPIRVRIEGSFQPGVTAKDAALYMVSLLGPMGANYKAIEFHGEINQLTMSDRLCLANMTVEAGAQTAYFPPDTVTQHHLDLVGASGKPIYPDEDAEYVDEHSIDLSTLEPMVAEPYSPANAKPVSELEGVEVDQVFIGSCTNGRLEDME